MKTTFRILMLILFIILPFACTKDKMSLPAISTKPVTFITIFSAVSGGEMSGLSPSITSKGICWSKNANPTVFDSIANDNSENSKFYLDMKNLLPNTVYYVRAFATNSTGTGYGDQISFTTLTDYSGQTGTVSDIDGNTYPSIGIGSQIWMIKNLQTTKFNDGTLIPNVTDNSAWSVLSTPAYCFYNNNLANKTAYGVLYNWYVADLFSNGNKNVCPTGWHVPTDLEYITLTLYLDQVGKNLKESGFSGILGGVRYDTGPFDGIELDGLFWTSTSYQSKIAQRFQLNGDYGDAFTGTSEGFGLSIRCLKN